jgi:cytosine/adenosine deaminase-related metal-dependent hydrolase
LRTLNRFLLAAAIAAAGVWLGLRVLLPPALPTPARASLVISGVTVINPGIGRYEDQSIVVRDGRIASVRPRDAGDPAPLCDGCFAVPGLIDAHVHTPPRIAIGNQELFALLYLANGVTTVRDVGASDASIAGLAERLAAGALPGPRMIRCGPVLDGDPPGWPIATVVRGAAEAAPLVDRLADEGVGCIKVYNEVSKVAFEAIDHAARSRGLPLIGHVPHAVGLGGVSDFESQHLTGVPYLHRPRPPHGWDIRDEDVMALGDGETEEALAVAQRQRVSFTPTLANFRLRLSASDPVRFPPPAGAALLPAFWSDAWQIIAGHPTGEPAIARRLDSLLALQDLVRRAHQRGIPILAGSDTLMPFVVPGEALHLELQALHEAFGSSEAALASATTVSGRHIAEGEIGVIAPGARADLLILREDPTRRLGALRDWQHVFADGRRYDRTTVNTWLDLYKQHFHDRLYAGALGGIVALAVDGFGKPPKDEAPRPLAVAPGAVSSR